MAKIIRRRTREYKVYICDACFDYIGKMPTRPPCTHPLCLFYSDPRNWSTSEGDAEFLLNIVRIWTEKIIDLIVQRDINLISKRNNAVSKAKQALDEVTEKRAYHFITAMLKEGMSYLAITRLMNHYKFYPRQEGTWSVKQVQNIWKRFNKE
jgi:hypothetical protein